MVLWSCMMIDQCFFTQLLELLMEFCTSVDKYLTKWELIWSNLQLFKGLLMCFTPYVLLVNLCYRGKMFSNVIESFVHGGHSLYTLIKTCNKKGIFKFCYEIMAYFRYILNILLEWVINTLYIYKEVATNIFMHVVWNKWKWLPHDPLMNF
jgi:hypothetical protein